MRRPRWMVAAVATLGVGIAAMGVVGLLGAGWLGFWIPRKVPPSPENTLMKGKAD